MVHDNKIKISYPIHINFIRNNNNNNHKQVQLHFVKYIIYIPFYKFLYTYV